MSEKTSMIASDEQDPHSYQKFSELVSSMKDDAMLEVADGLLKDMAEVIRMKQRIEKIESSYIEGKRAAFYFFTLSLSDEEIAFASQNVKGRRRVLAEKAKREEQEKQRLEAANSEEVSEEKPSEE